MAIYRSDLLRRSLQDEISLQIIVKNNKYSLTFYLINYNLKLL